MPRESHDSQEHFLVRWFPTNWQQTSTDAPWEAAVCAMWVPWRYLYESVFQDVESCFKTMWFSNFGAPPTKEKILDETGLGDQH